MIRFSKLFTAPAALAAAALCAVPAAALDLPAVSHSHNAEPASHYGPWDRGRWGRHRDRGVDAGDILTGVLILGGIAAVASAVSKNNDRTRSYPDTRPYPDQPRAYRTNANGIDGAVDMCVREVERNARVAQVDRVERDASGWLVTGALAAGGGFSCSIGSDGRIERLDTNLPGGTYGSDDRQYGDDAYYSARARLDGAPPADAQPAYPGGPLPGDPVYDDLPGG